MCVCVCVYMLATIANCPNFWVLVIVMENICVFQFDLLYRPILKNHHDYSMNQKASYW